MGTSKTRLKRAVRDVSTNCLGLRARVIERVVSGIFDRQLRPLGLRNTQVTLLTAIAKAELVTPRALGQALDLEKSTVSRTLDRMIERGWVQTVEVEDGRSYGVRLTAVGEDTLLEAYPAWRAAQREVEALLGDSLGTGLHDIAGRLNSGLLESSGDPS
ncbi:MAG: MarR family winged helix-turn-helix transcriptional regulator [Nannocystales bacterium]